MIARRLLPALALLPALPARAQRVMDVTRADPDRRALMDAIRPALERETQGPVEFGVRELRRSGDFAFGVLNPQRPGGTPIRWQDTRFAQALRAGAFDGGTTYVLWRWESGGWRVLEYAIGPTDVVWIDWQQRHRLPEALFSGAGGK